MCVATSRQSYLIIIWDVNFICEDSGLFRHWMLSLRMNRRHRVTHELNMVIQNVGRECLPWVRGTYRWRLEDMFFEWRTVAFMGDTDITRPLVFGDCAV